MRNLISKLSTNDLIKGVGLFFIGNMIVNIGGFVYHVIMARSLGPVEYGILGSLIGLTYFASIPIGALDILITKGISSLHGIDAVRGSKSFLTYLFGKLKTWMVVLTVVLLGSTGLVANFLHIDQWSGVAMVWVMVYCLIFSSIGLAVLRALLMFKHIVINQVTSIILRIVLSTGLVLLVSPTYLGAQMGVIASMVVALGLLIFQLRFLIKATPLKVLPKLNLRNLGLTSLLFSGAFTSMYSLDIVFVKHFLTEYWAGIYTSLATGGKIVFFALSPIAIVLLPIVSKRVALKLSIKSEFVTIILISLLLGGGIVAGYFLFSPMIVDVLFTHRFSDASIYLPWFGVAMLGYSLANILGSFLLALNKMRVVVIAIAGLGLELGLISLFNANLWQVIRGVTIAFWGEAVILFVYCLYAIKGKD